MKLRYIGINPELPKEVIVLLNEDTVLKDVLIATPFNSIKKQLSFLSGTTKITLEDLVSDSDDILVLHVLGGG
ncbi:MAG TPA: hypothetical protein DEA51_02090 [Erysipelotrichaceae bacterium]|nr:hypothetical protein [Erysipelotrichaceae bacterium]